MDYCGKRKEPGVLQDTPGDNMQLTLYTEQAVAVAVVI